MAFVVQIHINNHPLSAPPEAAKEAFARTVEWQVAHTLATLPLAMASEVSQLPILHRQ
jgi:hypothetical protein